VAAASVTSGRGVAIEIADGTIAQAGGDIETTHDARAETTFRDVERHDTTSPGDRRSPWPEPSKPMQPQHVAGE
jgi:hypothetical protein